MTTALSLLVATDLSAPSLHAARRAAMLARQTGGRLELLHVLEKDALTELRRLFTMGGEAMEERLRAMAQTALTQLAAELASPGPLLIVCHLVEGAVLNVITAQSELHDTDLVVVGACGAGFMHHWLLGATAERLIRKTQKPVLVVKTVPSQVYGSVLVAVDFSALSIQAIKLARIVGPQAHLVLLHACELPYEGKMRFAGVEENIIRQHRETLGREALVRLQAIATDAGLTDAQWHPLVAFDNPSEYVLEQEVEHGVDLIVMGKHGLGKTEELLLGSVTKHVLNQARSDVLVVR